MYAITAVRIQKLECIFKERWTFLTLPKLWNKEEAVLQLALSNEASKYYEGL